MSWINAILNDGGPAAKALCLGLAAALSLASLTVPAAARWANENDHRVDHRVEHRDDRQGWNGGYYRAPPVVYQNSAPAYYAPPLVYGSGINLSINLP